MKRLLIILVVVVALATLVTGSYLVGVGEKGGTLVAAQESQSELWPAVPAVPTLTIWPPVAELHEDTLLVLLGSGFEPGKELVVILQSLDGSVSNAVYLLSADSEGEGRGPLYADERGNFAVLFPVDRFERTQIEGVYAIFVTDTSYNALASAPIGFADPQGRSRVGIYPEGSVPDYSDPNDPRPLEWTEPFFDYPERPEEEDD